MSRFTGPKGKIVRRFGINIFGNPKFDRLLSKQPNAPGVHGARKKMKRKMSDFGLQMTEKQKMKYYYGIGEHQFRVIFAKAQKKKGVTGDNLLILLEARLDNVIYRSGMAPTRDAARQLISHGHIKVNNRRVNIPSYHLTADNEITVKDSAKSRALVQHYLEKNRSGRVARLGYVRQRTIKRTMLRPPIRSEIQPIANEQLIVELYSK